MMRVAKIILIFLFGFLIILCMKLNEEKGMTDLILLHGKIYTVDKAEPWVEACAITDGKIIAVGNTDKISRLQGENTEVIDLRGRLALPGFNDAHVHFADGGFYLMGINLRDAKDKDEFADRIGDFTRKLEKGEWILGGNWDHEAWPSKTYPTKALIDKASQENPVFVSRLDGHVALANSLALKMAGITKDTPDPQGGEIEKDPKTGEPTGILKDTAQELVGRVIPPPSKEQLIQAVQTAMAHANRYGVTSIQDNTAHETFRVYQELLNQGKLTLRINAWIAVDDYQEVEKIGILPPFGNSMLRLGTIKMFIDGSMGAGTALFYDPYTDDPSTSGLPIYPEKKLYDLVAAVDKDGLQIAAHAIGDKANTWALNAFERAFKENGNRDARHRIEHAQVVLPEDMQRFADLGIIASIQPSHCIDDMRWAEKRIGDRVKYAYLFNAFTRAGVKIAFGTDWTVEPINPMLGIYAAVTREFPEGGPEGGWFPEEKMTLEQAVECYTLGSAYAEFQEHVKGAIRPGMLADLVVLDKNMFEIPPKEILNTNVDMTILGGNVVYERK